MIDENGIDLDLVKEIKEVRRERISEYARLKGTGAHFLESGSIWDAPCNVALPCARQNELSGRKAVTLIKDGVLSVAEGANMPCTREAVQAFQSAEILFAPGKAANAGGVATSALEMQQNARRDRWTLEQTNARLSELIAGIHDRCRETAEEYGAPGDYILERTSPASCESRRRCVRSVWSKANHEWHRSGPWALWVTKARKK